MDRPIPKSQICTRWIRRIVVGSVCTVLAVGGVGLEYSLIRPSIGHARIHTAVVGQGPMEATLSARGTVVSSHKHIITSPIESRVMKILLSPGSDVTAGEAIVQLDMSATEKA